MPTLWHVTFSPLHPSMQGLGTGIRVPAGQVLTVEGAVGREFFVVEQGRAGVTREGAPVGLLGPGTTSVRSPCSRPDAGARPR